MITSKLLFTKNDQGFYRPPGTLEGDLILRMVGNIFTDGTSVSGLDKDLLDKKFCGTAGNRYRIDSEGGDKLRIGDQFDEEEEYYVDFSKKTLLKLLDQWLNLVSKNTDVIVFYRNGDEYSMVDAQDFHEA